MECFIDTVVGMTGKQDSVFKLGKSAEFGFGLKEYFVFQGEITPAHRILQGVEGRLADFLLVVEQPQYLIELAGIDRFEDIGQPTRAQYSVDFFQRLAHQGDRHMMQ
nr:hypothetical protein [Thiolapillus sp.]